MFVFIGASLLGSWVGLSTPSAMIIGEIASALLVVALFFVGTDITRKTLQSLRLTTVLHGVALWLLVIPAVLWGVTMWVP